MQLIFGIVLLFIGIFSGGIGVVAMGGGISIPSLLVIGFGLFLILNHLTKNSKSFLNKNKFFLGILFILLGLINLFFKNSLILISLAFLIGGIYLITVSIRRFEDNDNKETPIISESTKKIKIKKKVTTNTNYGNFGLYIIIIMFSFLIVIIVSASLENSNKDNKSNNFRSKSIYKDELKMCEIKIKEKFPTTNFSSIQFVNFQNIKSNKKKIKISLKNDFLFFKNQDFGYIDCTININMDGSIFFDNLSNKY